MFFFRSSLSLYSSVVSVLAVCPFFKFWWNEELNMLKEASAESNNLCKAAG